MVLKKADKSKEAEVKSVKTVQAKVQAKEDTEGDKIWSKIKDLPIEIFALPDQHVQDHVKFESQLTAADPNSVYLTLRSAAVKPALEESLGRVNLGQNALKQKLVFELSEMARYTVVKIVPRAH